jgi:DNA-binding NarL/FixJ family response regulator
MRVVLADDHLIVLKGLEQFLAQEPDVVVVDRCATGEAALEAVRREKPDVLILDVAMPRLDGLEVLEIMLAEGSPTRVVILTAALDEDDLIEAVRLGVKGIVLKEMAPEFLIRCLRQVHAGGQWLEGEFVGRALDTVVTRDAEARKLAAVLTPREIDIMRLVAAGLRNKEIGRQLSIAEGTVKIHIHNIYEKLGLNSRVALATYARDTVFADRPREASPRTPPQRS